MSSSTVEPFISLGNSPTKMCHCHKLEYLSLCHKLMPTTCQGDVSWLKSGSKILVYDSDTNLNSVQHSYHIHNSVSVILFYESVTLCYKSVSRYLKALTCTFMVVTWYRKMSLYIQKSIVMSTFLFSAILNNSSL